MEKIEALEQLRKASSDNYHHRQTYEWKMCITIWTPIVAFIGISLTHPEAWIPRSTLIIACLFLAVVHLLWQLNIKASNDKDADKIRECEQEMRKQLGLSKSEAPKGFLVFKGWPHYIYLFITIGLIILAIYINDLNQIVILPNELNEGGYVSLIALALSIFALAFTIFSFWWMNWRKGTLEISNIRTYAAVSSGNNLMIELPIVFFNPGALPILINNLRLIFPDCGGPHTALCFTATVEKLGTDEGRAMATPFAVHKGEALLKICEFHRLRSGFVFEAQNYEIVIEALIGEAIDWKVIKTFQLKVRESQIEALNRTFIAHDNEPQLSQP